MSAAAEEAPTPAEVQAPSAAPRPKLRKEMSAADLITYLQEFSTSTGTKLFADAAVDRVELLSSRDRPMEVLFDMSSSAAKWRSVANQLFGGDQSTAELFQMKVREAKVLSSQAEKVHESKMANHEAKQAMLANKRKQDVPSQREDEGQEQAPKQPKVNPFEKMMTPGAQELTFLESRMLYVKWPKDFDAHGSQTYKYFRDSKEVRDNMTGWELTTHGLSFPKAMGKQVEEEEEEDSEVGPLHPLFKFHKQWVFRLSGVALKNLADEYKVTSIEGKTIDSRHFLKMAAKAEKQRKEDEKKAQPKKPCVPRNLKALAEVQEQELVDLKKQFAFKLEPLELRVREIQAEHTTAMLEHGFNSESAMDVAFRLEAAAGEVKCVKDELKKAEAQLSSRHIVQTGEAKTTNKTVRSEFRAAATWQRAAVQPADPEPEQPAAVQPATEQSTAAAQPAAEQHATEQPTAAAQPAAVQPAAEQRTTEQLDAAEPAAVQPAAVQPAAVQPAATQPTVEQPVSTIPTIANPFAAAIW